MTFKPTLLSLPLLCLMLTLAGCGTLADRREARGTAQALPVMSATVGPAAPLDAVGVSPTTASTEPAPALDAATEPPPVLGSAPTPSATAPPTTAPMSPTATVAPQADTAGEELLTLLDQLGADLEGEDGGVEQDLP